MLETMETSQTKREWKCHNAGNDSEFLDGRRPVLTIATALHFLIA